MQPHPSGESLPQAIQAIHAAIAEHPEPQSKQILSSCLQNMLKVQAQDMQAQQGATGGPQQAPSGQQAVGSPQGSQGPPPQLQALLSALGQ